MMHRRMGAFPRKKRRRAHPFNAKLTRLTSN